MQDPHNFSDALWELCRRRDGVYVADSTPEDLGAAIPLSQSVTATVCDFSIVTITSS